jgi:predicted RNase H-like HicB family nuclease
MPSSFTLQYWTDGGWYVGRLKGVPGVFSQGRTLEELEENIRDAYRLRIEDEAEETPEGAQTKEVELEV